MCLPCCVTKSQMTIMVGGLETNPCLASSQAAHSFGRSLRLEFANKSLSLSLSQLLLLLPTYGESRAVTVAAGLINCESFPRTRIKLKREGRKEAGEERGTRDGSGGCLLRGPSTSQSIEKKLASHDDKANVPPLFLLPILGLLSFCPSFPLSVRRDNRLPFLPIRHSSRFLMEPRTL